MQLMPMTKILVVISMDVRRLHEKISRIGLLTSPEFTFDTRDDFHFNILNFPLHSINMPFGPSYGVYVSHLIRYARCCPHYDDFRYRHKCLVDRLLSQGYIALQLQKLFKKFYGRYQDLIEK